MKITQPILITGIPRSGASMISGIISMCGGFGGVLSSMGENPRIKEMNTIVLNNLGMDSAGQFPLPDASQIPVINDWVALTSFIMHQQGYNDANTWFCKDSRIALLWKTWNAAFPQAKWIVVKRNTNDIVESCLKTGYMRAFKDPKILSQIGKTSVVDGWKWWIEQYNERFLDIANNVSNLVTIYPERMVWNDYSEIKRTIEWLGLEWNDEVTTFMNTKLNKVKVSKGVNHGK